MVPEGAFNHQSPLVEVVAVEHRGEGRSRKQRCQQRVFHQQQLLLSAASPELLPVNGRLLPQPGKRP